MSAPPSDSRSSSASSSAASSETRSPAPQPGTSTAGWQLEVNGELRSFASEEAPASVAQLLERLELAGKRVAVAVNRVVIVRSRYAEAGLSDGDRVEILEAVGGG